MISYRCTALSKQNRARRGVLRTGRGDVQTPAFMPVGTQGTVKGLSSEELEALGFEMILVNTYHLELRPGSALVEEVGGIHSFSNWKGSVLSDSGGYQVMSLSANRTISDEGVEFRSHLDGSKLFLTPEESIAIQGRLGVNISMCLDECPPYPCSREEAVAAMNRTHLWAPRNLAAKKPGQAVFGIVQGGVHPDLRSESAQFISGLEFDGVAIGGVSVGEPTEMQYPVVTHTAPLLPTDRPRYLMGVGHPRDILHAVAQGVDLFDCVLPTRMARHHALYTLNGRVNALNKKWEKQTEPYDEHSAFSALDGYSPAYLRHLFKAGEALGARLASLHNLAFYARLMQEIRDAIEGGTWEELEARYANA